LPGLPTAPPKPKTPRPTVEGKGTPPDKAIDWQPTEEDQADFAAFTCADKEQVDDISDQPLFACDETKTVKYLLGPTLIEGDQLTSAIAGVPQNDVRWVVNLEFNADGATAFENATRAIAQRTDPQNRFAIVLDGVVISAPSVSAAIPGGRAEISGNFNQKSATELANVLKYGALPLAFDVSEVANVSATLGGEQLRAGIIAGIIGLALVVAFCFLYYRGLGIVVVASAGDRRDDHLRRDGAARRLGRLRAELLPVSRAIVAIGITADSFVIYFERIRDEVREGRSLRTAVETGWRRARQTILIADTVSLLSAPDPIHPGHRLGEGLRLHPWTHHDDRRAGGLHLHQAADVAARPDEVLRRRPPVVRPGSGASRRQVAARCADPAGCGGAAGEPRG
jgi:preprotein translocase subunit SecD